MWGDPSRSTVPIETPRRKDITMKLLCILAAFLAISLGEDTDQKEIEDSEAVATVELLKTSPDILQTAESSYNYYPNQKSDYVEPKNNAYYAPAPANSNYNQQANYPNQNTYPNNNNYYPNNNNYYPQNNYITTQKPIPPQNSYVPPQNDYVQNTYVPPQNTYVPPQNTYVPPQNTYVPPQNNYVPPNNNYVPPNNNWKPPANPTTTTPSSIIKNEINFGDNGSYKYEYEIADGTHASEEGYLLYPNTEHESLVKRGWYSYKGPDGKVYTVTWWADHTGFHAAGDHIPTPPPIPPAIQASIEQNAKEEAQKEAEKNKQPQQTYPTQNPQPGYYPTQTQKPQTGYYPTQTQKPQTGYYPTQAPYPTQQTYYPPQQTYYPSQQTYYPQQNPSYGK